MNLSQQLAQAGPILDAAPKLTTYSVAIKSLFRTSRRPLL